MLQHSIKRKLQHRLQHRLQYLDLSKIHIQDARCFLPTRQDQLEHKALAITYLIRIRTTAFWNFHPMYWSRRMVVSGRLGLPILGTARDHHLLTGCTRTRVNPGQHLRRRVARIPSLSTMNGTSQLIQDKGNATRVHANSMCISTQRLSYHKAVLV